MNVRGNSKKIIAGALFAISMFSVSTGLTGCLTDDGDKGGGGDSVTSKSTTLGAQASATGSFLEADAMAAKTIAEAKTIASNIDLVLAFSESQTSLSIYSPKAAADGIAGTPGFDFVKTTLGTSARDTEIRVISTAGFDTVKTTVGVKALYDAGVKDDDGRLAAQQNTTFAIKTNGGKIVAIKITAVSGTTSGTATVEGKTKF